MSLIPVQLQLEAIRLSLRQRAKAEAAAREAALVAAKLAQAEKDLFARTVGPVQALRPHNRSVHERPPVEPQALQRQKDEQAVMQEALSDEFDVESLLDTDDSLSYRRLGLGQDVIKKLRRGHWSLQGQIDLHGLRSDEARVALGHFLRDAHRLGWRCVRVVHGKGLGSPGRVPVLKSKVQRWLVQKNEVLAFVQARADDGGAGAVIVLLAPGKR
ncbi:MAG: putative endonuclease SmrA [Pseudomonadota bacterium]|jgi:DNA-nicking Smr family endonuclease